LSAPPRSLATWRTIKKPEIKWPPASPEQQKKRAKFWLVK
jgi:hypothetical protein